MSGFSWQTRIDSGRNGMTYTALGASNTCGHGLKARELPFQALLYLELRKRHSVRGFQPSCIAAMGPEYPSSCLDYFAPNTTRFATLEFTPNMGEELERQVSYFESMIARLQRRQGHVAIIDLVPRPPGCRTCIESFEASHAQVERLARRTRAPLVTLRYNESTWSDDLKHLNREGHRWVAARVMEVFDAAVEDERSGEADDDLPTTALPHLLPRRRNRRRPFGIDQSSSDSAGAAQSTASSTAADIPKCIFGADLKTLVLPGSRGFSLLDTGRFRDKPGLLGTRPGALLRLCLRGLPLSFGVSVAFERSDVLPMSNVSLGCEPGCVCPLELLSNGDWTLHFQGKGNRRATESYMHRVFGARRRVGVSQALPSPPTRAVIGRATAGHAAGLDSGVSACDCVLTLRNTQLATDARARFKINGLVAGASNRISWANRFHMGLNPNVLSG